MQRDVVAFLVPAVQGVAQGVGQAQVAPGVGVLVEQSQPAHVVLVLRAVRTGQTPHRHRPRVDAVTLMALDVELDVGAE